MGLRRFLPGRRRPRNAPATNEARAAEAPPHATAERLLAALDAQRASHHGLVLKSDLHLLLATCGGALVLVAGLFQAELTQLTNRLDQREREAQAAALCLPDTPPSRVAEPQRPYGMSLEDFVTRCMERNGTGTLRPLVCRLPDQPDEVRGQGVVFLARPFPPVGE